MTLFYLLLNLSDVNAKDLRRSHFSLVQLIYAGAPWTPESQAIVMHSVSPPAPKLEIDGICYSYFLDLSLAQKLLQVYSTRNLCLADHCQRVIEYALQAHAKDP